MAKAVNAAGGLACRQVELYSVDDGADPARTAAAVAELVQQKRVVALVGMISVLTPAAMRNAAERFKIPIIGGDVLAYEWNKSPYLFPQGASIASQAYGLARQTVLEGMPKAGILYCVETPTCGSLAKDIEGDLGKKAGIQIVYSSPVTIVATDYTAQCQNAKNAGAQVLGLAMDGSAISRVVRSCAAIGYTPPVVTGAIALGPAGSADPGIRRNTVLSSTMNAPWMLSDTPGQRAYQAAMKRFAPSVALDAGSIMTWSAGKLAEAAVQRMPAGARMAAIGSADLLAALGRIKGETLDGLAPPLTFEAGKPAPDARCTFYVRLTERGWDARGSKPACPN